MATERMAFFDAMKLWSSLGNLPKDNGLVYPLQHDWEFALHANYPNPFNPTTRIAYDLPEAGPVRLEIVNVLGQRAALLLETRQEAGRHVIVWDGRTASGAKAAAGLYFCRMTAGEFAKTIKMTLLP